jgi:hypothetical protein
MRYFTEVGRTLPVERLKRVNKHIQIQKNVLSGIFCTNYANFAHKPKLPKLTRGSFYFNFF